MTANGKLLFFNDLALVEQKPSLRIQKENQLLHAMIQANNFQPLNPRKTSDALVPPKPNEFDNATSMLRLRGFCGTRSI